MTVGQDALQAVEKTTLRDGQKVIAIEAVFEVGLECLVAHHNGRIAHLPQCDLRVAGDAIAARCAGVICQTQLWCLRSLADPGKGQWIALSGCQTRLTDHDGDVLHTAIWGELGLVKSLPGLAQIQGNFDALVACARVVAANGQLGIGGDVVSLCRAVRTSVLVEIHGELRCAQLHCAQAACCFDSTQRR